MVGKDKRQEESMTQKEIDLVHDFIDGDLVMEDTLDHDDILFARSLVDGGYVERVGDVYQTVQRDDLEKLLEDDCIVKRATRATHGRA